MDQPDATSPEVADACRRAGLPYAEPAIATYGRGLHDMNAAMASPMPPSAAAERAYDLLSALQRQLELVRRLYGPALAAPMSATAEDLHAALECWRGEAWEGARLRDSLERDLFRLERQRSELLGERDRARDVAVALEQQLAGVDDVVGRLRGEVIAEAETAVAGAIPTLPDIDDDGPLGWNRGRNAGRELALSAVRELHHRKPAPWRPLGFDVVVDPALPDDVAELRHRDGSLAATIRIGDVPPIGGGLADLPAGDPTARPARAFGGCSSCGVDPGQVHRTGCGSSDPGGC